MTSKRFARVAWTFSISPIWLFGTKSEPFNTHARYDSCPAKWLFAPDEIVLDVDVSSFPGIAYCSWPNQSAS